MVDYYGHNTIGSGIGIPASQFEVFLFVFECFVGFVAGAAEGFAGGGCLYHLAVELYSLPAFGDWEYASGLEVVVVAGGGHGLLGVVIIFLYHS
jgi:hypothetical protein